MTRLRERIVVTLGALVVPGVAWATPHAQVFNPAKTNVLVALLLFLAVFTYYWWAGRAGKAFFIRRIAALDAVDEAIGRATEMGRPVLFLAGIQDVDDVQTLAGLSVLSHVARKAAQNRVDILMPNRSGMVMATAQEVVKEAYMHAGVPDAFRPDKIYYVSDEQFALVAHTDGLMVRERPAANFYMGSFFAESLILAETGHSTGAIQIAGTANAHQLPFFVAACDYCLLGEELYAASAYLSKDPKLVASIRGQDVLKLVILAVAVIGIVLLAPLSRPVHALRSVPALFQAAGE